MGRAASAGLVEFEVCSLREFGLGRHRIVDGRPYGGGEGMVLRADVLARALGSLRTPDSRVILLSPQGRRLNAELSGQLLPQSHLVLVCGHYEGVDERFIQKHVDLEVSIGDYVLSGGELPALVLTDWLVRQIPGAVGNPDSVAKDSFSDGHLKHPQYTRPPEFEGLAVPEVLQSGDHGKIEVFRRASSLENTQRKRPDLCAT